MIPGNILLIRPDRLGDLILSLPVARALKNEFPETRVTYLAAPYPAAIAGMVDYVDGWIIDGRPGVTPLPLRELSVAIKNGNYDCLIELKPSWRTAGAGFMAKIPIRIGTSRRIYSFYYNTRVKLHRKASGKHQTDLDLAMLKPLSINASNVLPTLSLKKDSAKTAGDLVGEKIDKYIVIHPGSGGSAPNWPESNYRELSKKILTMTGFGVVITGNESIRPFDDCLNLLGMTDLLGLAGVISGAALFISGSTGPLHLADALDRRCVSFFVDRADIGPQRWGPRRNLHNVLIPPGERCRCTNLSRCRCLERISPDTAFDKVASVLEIRADGK